MILVKNIIFYDTTTTHQNKKGKYGWEECLNCAKLTFFIKGVEGKCNECGYKMSVPPNDGKGGKGGKGGKCPFCGKYRVFNEICSECGAK